MPTTTNFGWTTPADTDLVKDGASAIRTLGSGIDTSFVDLKGGTTGQVLSKATNTDLDFSWTTVSATKNFSLLNSGGTALTGAQTVTVSGISGKDEIMVLVTGASSANASSTICVRFNADTGNNYYQYGTYGEFGTTYSKLSYGVWNGGASSYIALAASGDSASAAISGYVQLSGCNTAGVKIFNSAGASTPSGVNFSQAAFGGYYNSSSTISSVSIYSTTGNLDAGTVFVYTSA